MADPSTTKAAVHPKYTGPVALNTERAGAPRRATTGLAEPVDISDPALRYLNRELSELDFNARLLDLAAEPGVPLLERAKFLAIFSERVDEFFQVRVAGLKDQVAAGLVSRSPDGRTPLEQLRAIRAKVEVLVERQSSIFLGGLVHVLAQAGSTCATGSR